MRCGAAHVARGRSGGVRVGRRGEAGGDEVATCLSRPMCARRRRVRRTTWRRRSCISRGCRRPHAASAPRRRGGSTSPQLQERRRGRSRWGGDEATFPQPARLALAPEPRPHVCRSSYRHAGRPQQPPRGRSCKNKKPQLPRGGRANTTWGGGDVEHRGDAPPSPQGAARADEGWSPNLRSTTFGLVLETMADAVVTRWKRINQRKDRGARDRARRSSCWSSSVVLLEVVFHLPSPPPSGEHGPHHRLPPGG
jgi:hypothetical protein